MNTAKTKMTPYSVAMLIAYAATGFAFGYAYAQSESLTDSFPFMAANPPGGVQSK